MPRIISQVVGPGWFGVFEITDLTQVAGFGLLIFSLLMVTKGKLCPE